MIAANVKRAAIALSVIIAKNQTGLANPFQFASSGLKGDMGLPTSPATPKLQDVIAPARLVSLAPAV